jgi:hypothetical protein
VKHRGSKQGRRVDDFRGPSVRHRAFGQESTWPRTRPDRAHLRENATRKLHEGPPREPSAHGRPNILGTHRQMPCRSEQAVERQSTADCEIGGRRVLGHLRERST